MQDSVILHGRRFVPFILNRDILAAIDRVAEKVNAAYAGTESPVTILCVLNGALPFTAELMQRLNFPVKLSMIKLSSYAGTSSTGEVQTLFGPTGNIRGERVLVVEDIVDTGNTVEALKDILAGEGAAEVKLITLLLKPDMYHKDIPLDFVGMEIPTRFIVGYGLDYDELGRNLPDIYVLDD